MLKSAPKLWLRFLQFFLVLNLPAAVIMNLFHVSEYVDTGVGPFCDGDAGILSGLWMFVTVPPLLLASVYFFWRGFKGGQWLFKALALTELLLYGVKIYQHYEFSLTQLDCRRSKMRQALVYSSLAPSGTSLSS